MARLSKEELLKIMEKYKVDKLWSWSKINTFHISPYSYFLSYIKHIAGDRANSIYSVSGGMAHDILEKLYTGRISFEEMDEAFEDAWTIAYDISQLKFDRNDEEKNQKIGDKYYDNLKHFFNHHSVIPYKTAIEQFIDIDINGNIFQGYMDCVFKDNEGNYNIIDFKTSTIYKGDKALNECGQLVLYAIGLNQKGIPFENIRIAWNFLKYVSIEYEQANGTIKTREVERCKIGESLQSNLKTWLKKLGYIDQMENMLQDVLDSNSIENLPQEVQDKYKIYDCYVYVPLTQKLVDEWTEYIITIIKDIELREADYNETKSDKAFWDDEELLKSNSYFHATLSEYSPNQHLPYKAYIEKLEAVKNGQDMFAGIGDDAVSSSEIKENKPNNNDDTDDLSWLNDIV